MAISRQKKEEIFSRLQDIFKTTESVVFVNFHGLSHGDENTMRQALNREGVGYFVAKKTLVRKALLETSYTGDIPQTEGELAVVYGNDLIAPARGVYEFVKKHKEKLAILGGVFEGRYMDKDSMTAIATIPPLEVLYGQIANVINSPIQGFVMALDQIAKKKEASAS